MSNTLTHTESLGNLLPDPDVILATSLEAVHNGTIQARPYDGSVSAMDNIVFSPNIQIQKKWLDLATIPTYWPESIDHVTFHGDSDDPSILPEYEADYKAAFDENLSQYIAAGEKWWEDPEIKESIDEGRLTDAFEITCGEYTIPLVNFSKQEVTQSFLDQLQKALETVSRDSGAAVWQRLKAICIQDMSKLGPKAALSLSRLGHGTGTVAIRVNEGLIISEEIYEKHIEYKDSQKMRLENQKGVIETDFEHELWHVVAQGTGDEIWRESTGWNEANLLPGQDDHGNRTEKRIFSGVDDYGNQFDIKLQKLGLPPLEVETTEGTKRVENILGDVAVTNIKAPTQYGAENHIEDSAESYKSGDKFIDPLRQEVIKVILQKAKNIYGEAPTGGITIQKVDKSILQDPKVNPRVVYYNPVYATWELGS